MNSLRFLIAFVFFLTTSSASAQTNQVPVMTGPCTSGVCMTASSTNTGHDAWKAGDADASTNWEVAYPSVSLPQWHKTDFGSNKTIGSYAITAFSSPNYFTAWSLACSPDDATYTTLDQKSGQSFAGQRRVFSITSPVACRHYKWTCEANATYANDCLLVRIEYFDQTVEPPAPPPQALIPANKALISLPFARPQSFDLLAGAAPSSMPANDTLQSTDRWQYMVARHTDAQPQLAAAGGHIAVIGDSIIHKSDVSQISPFAFNYGITADTAGGIVNRIGSYTALHAARAVVLELPGLNDFSANIPLATVQANIAAILNWLTGPLVIVKVTPTNDSSLNAKTAALNAWIDGAVAGRAQTVVVDVGPQLSTGGLLNSAYSGDGVHLNAAGWTIYSAAVIAALGNI